MKLPVVPLDELDNSDQEAIRLLPLTSSNLPLLTPVQATLYAPPRPPPSLVATPPTPTFAWTPFRALFALWFAPLAFIGQAKWVAALFAGASMTITVRGCENFQPYVRTITKEGELLLSERAPILAGLLLAFGIIGIVAWLLARLGGQDTAQFGLLVTLGAAIAGAFSLGLISVDFTEGAGTGAALLFLGRVPASLLGGFLSLILAPPPHHWNRTVWFWLHTLLAFHVHGLLLAATLPLAAWMLDNNSWPYFWYFLASSLLVAAVGIGRALK